MKIHLSILISILVFAFSLQSQSPQVVYDTTLFWTQAGESIKTLIPDDSGGMYTIGHIPDRGFKGHRGIALGRWDDQGYGRVIDYGVAGKDDHAFGAWRYEDRIITVGYRNKDSIPVRGTGFPSELVTTKIDMATGLVLEEVVHEEYWNANHGLEHFGSLNWIRPLGQGLYLGTGKNNLILFREDGELIWNQRYFQDSMSFLLPFGVLLDDKIATWVSWVKGTQPGQTPYYILGYGLAFFDRYTGEFIEIKEHQILKNFYSFTSQANTIIAIGKIPFTKLNLRTGLDTLFYYPGMIKYSANGDSLSTQLFDFPGDDMKYHPYVSHLLPNGKILQGGMLLGHNWRVGDTTGYILKYDLEKKYADWIVYIDDPSSQGNIVENIEISTRGDIFIAARNSSMRLYRLSGDTTLRPLSRAPAREALHVQLMPNPARTRVRVQTAAPVDFHLSDLQGKTVRQVSLRTSGYIPLSDLSSGLYLWHATDAHGRRAQGKLVVE